MQNIGFDEAEMEPFDVAEGLEWQCRGKGSLSCCAQPRPVSCRVVLTRVRLQATQPVLAAEVRSAPPQVHGPLLAQDGAPNEGQTMLPKSPLDEKDFSRKKLSSAY